MHEGGQEEDEEGVDEESILFEEYDEEADSLLDEMVPSVQYILFKNSNILIHPMPYKNIEEN